MASQAEELSAASAARLKDLTNQVEAGLPVDAGLALAYVAGLTDSLKVIVGAFTGDEPASSSLEDVFRV